MFSTEPKNKFIKILWFKANRLTNDEGSAIENL